MTRYGATEPAGGIGSDYTAMERSASQSATKTPLLCVAIASAIAGHPDSGNDLLLWHDAEAIGVPSLDLPIVQSRRMLKLSQKRMDMLRISSAVHWKRSGYSGYIAMRA
jgi:hypothetical protein